MIKKNKKIYPYQFEVTILGSSSASLQKNKNFSAQLLKINNVHILLDCGEGTQYKLINNELFNSKIKYILITHLHGDHFYGLVGLLSSFDLNCRKDDIFIFAPSKLKEILTIQLGNNFENLTYKVHFFELEPRINSKILDTEFFIIKCFKLLHINPTFGFFIKEKPFQRNIIKNKIENLDLKIDQLVDLKNSKDIILNGKKISYLSLTRSPLAQRSYTYCTDTTYYELSIKHYINTMYLYSECTYLDKHKELAIKTNHSTSKDVIKIAKKSKCKKLIIGHFSGRYKNNEILKEVKKGFKNTIFAKENKTIIIK